MCLSTLPHPWKLQGAVSGGSKENLQQPEIFKLSSMMAGIFCPHCELAALRWDLSSLDVMA